MLVSNAPILRHSITHYWNSLETSCTCCWRFTQEDSVDDGRTLWGSCAAREEGKDRWVTCVCLCPNDSHGQQSKALKVRSHAAFTFLHAHACSSPRSSLPSSTQHWNLYLRKLVTAKVCIHLLGPHDTQHDIREHRHLTSLCAWIVHDLC